MELIDLIRLLRKHLVLLLVTPVVLAALVIFLTKNPSYKYESEMTLFTGIASGSSIEMDKSFNYFASNIAFDNLISIIKSRETQQEVGIRLLAQHLMLDKSQPRYISADSYAKLRKMTPRYVQALTSKPLDQLPDTSSTKVQEQKEAAPAAAEVIQKTEELIHVVKSNETLFSISREHHITVDQLIALNGIKNNKILTGQKLKTGILATAETISMSTDTSKRGNPVNPADTAATFSFSNLSDSEQNSRSFLPPSVDLASYEKMVSRLNNLYNSSDTNFVYRLLNFTDPHYSIDAISSVNVQRITSSDLITLKYQSDDPGICQQTLVIFAEVCVKNYKKIKENRSDAVVKYFEFQLRQAASRLKSGEDKLLAFNKDNNIINYYEQSKAVAGVKEELDVDYNNMRIKLAGLYAAIKRLEEKLENQQLIQLKSTKIVDLRNQLGDINFKITSLETTGVSDVKDTQKLAALKIQSDKLKEEIKRAVGELYSYTTSVNGLPINTILTDWINNVIESENTKAGLQVMGDRIKEFQKQYAIYAPAGANLKRIEREISVSEQEFLEILHGLNLARLKMQDNELSSNIKTVDQPFFPLNPIPTKRKILIIAAAMFGFMIVLVTVLAMEYFDNTLKNIPRASKTLHLPLMAVFPKILLKTQNINFPYITNRMLEIAIQNIKLYLESSKSERATKTLLFFSSLNDEGKSVIAGNLAQKLKSQGEKVLYLNYSRKSLLQSEKSQMGYSDTSDYDPETETTNKRQRFSFAGWMLGYPDTRVDYDSPFLDSPEKYLTNEEYFVYQVDEKFYSVKNYRDILSRNGFYSSQIPDFVLIELPAILYYPYPVGLISDADLSALVCRSNRIWSTADQGVLDVILKLSNQKTQFVLNGVGLPVIESVLGDLPKKRSRLRRMIKNLFRLQFFSRNQF